MSDAIFGPYRLQALLGRGGMGEVWEALDTRKNRRVALKLLAPWTTSDEDYTRRFRREADLAAQLNCPHIIPIHDYGLIDSRLFIDMPIIRGTDLAVLLTRQGRIEPARAIDVVEQTARALDAAHAAGLVHRDVKPSNILVSDNGGQDFVHLIDFGIARGAESTRISVSGAMVGTPAYMAPERFDGDGDHRSDIYALGCVLYETLTGHPAFDAPNLYGFVRAHHEHPAPKATDVRDDLDLAIDEVIARALAKDPAERYFSAGELAASLRRAVARRSSPSEITTSGVEQCAPGRHDLVTHGAPDQSDARDFTVESPLLTVAVDSDRPASPVTAPSVEAVRPTLAPAPEAAAGESSALIERPPIEVTKPPAIERETGSDEPDVQPARSSHRGRRRLLFLAGPAVLAVVVIAALQALPEQGAVTGPSPANPTSAPSSPQATTTVRPVGSTSTLATGPINDISVSHDGRTVWSTELSASGTSYVLRAIDSATLQTRSQYDLPENGLELAASPDGTKVYLTGDSTVQVFDTSVGSVVSQIPVGVSPTALAISPDGRRVYVSGGPDGDQVQIIDTATNSVVGNLDLKQEVSDIAVAPDSRAAYVTSPTGVSVIDTQSDNVVARIPFSRPAFAMAISPDGATAYVSSDLAGEIFTVDLLERSISGKIRTDGPDNPNGFSPDGTKSYLLQAGSPALAVLDTATKKISRTFTVPNSAVFALSPDGRTAFVREPDGLSGITAVTVA